MKRTVKFDKKAQGSLRARLLRQLTLRSRAHAADEDGGIAIISLFIFILMLTMGGISVDLMRHEMERTQLQATLDSAVLAAAGAPAGATKQEIKSIVEDFFAKSGKADYLNNIGDDDIDNTLNARRVTASADMTINTYLMKLMGVGQLTAAGGATAEVRTPKLEVVIVLDVSGSMSGTKLANLKVAAKEFVTTILNSSDPGSTVISIVPYSWGVTPSDGMYEALNVDESHDYATCLVFEEDDYLTPAIDTTTSYRQRIYTTGEWSDDTFDNVENGTLTSGYSPKYNRTCFTDEYFRIMPFSISETALHTKIDSLQAAGSTSSHLGMKWAAGLLDPAFTNILTVLQTPREYVQDDGSTAWVTEIDPSLTDLPSQYNEPDTRKVIVMMGDGKNDKTFIFSDPNGLLDRSTAETHTAFDYRGPESYLHKVEYTDDVFQYAYDIYNPARVWYQSWVIAYCYLNWLECVYESETVSAYYVYKPSNDRYYPTDGSCLDFVL